MKYPTGRKHCSRCGCWRQTWEFARASKWGYLAARCRTCDRLYHRHRGNHEARDGNACRNGHAWTHDTPRDSRGNRYCPICRREYDRIWSQSKRREIGSPERCLRRAAPRRPGEPVQLPSGPFAAWLRDHAPDEIYPWARALGVDDSGLRRHIKGQTAEVHIDFVDRVLTASGFHLAEVYPDLYETAA